MDYIINFANNLDPNGPTQMAWPQYNTSTLTMMTFQDGFIPKVLSQDNYRHSAMAFSIQMGQKYPL